MKAFRLLSIAALSLFVQDDLGHAQTANGRATTTPPSYTNNSPAPLSLDLDGNLRVNCITGCSGGGGGSDVNIDAVGGNPVTTTVPISGTVTTGGLTDTELRATPVPVSGTVTATTGGLTDTQLRATPVPISGNLTTVSTVTSVTGATVIPATNTAGTSNHSLIAAASTNATNVKASAGTLYEISVYNNSANIAYLKLYNSASAPTCGAGTIVARYLIPGAASGGAGSNVVIPLGKSFSTGIAYCITGGIADADTTAVAASAYIVNMTYK